MNTIIFSTALIATMLLYMSLWFVVAVRAKRFDVVDSAWGLGFVVVAWLSLTLQGNFGTAQLVSALLVSFWGIRLCVHISRRTLSKKEEDHRYQTLRASWGDHALRSAYFRIFLLQGGLILLVSLPMIAIAVSDSPITLATYGGWGLWLFGIIFEAVADRQLRTFIAIRTPGSHTLMDRGLWRYSRHPNYFGEITAWWGAAIVAISMGALWGILGSALITYLIIWVSGIPPLEKHYADNAAYQAYARVTSRLIPLPRKRA